MQASVEEFHRVMDLTVGASPAVRDPDLRMALIREEVLEAGKALRDLDVVESAKELCDVLYVVFGTAVTFGIRLVPAASRLPVARWTEIRDGAALAAALEALGKTTCSEIASGDLESIEPTLADLAGLALAIGDTCGLRLPQSFNLVHASNMTKAGGPVRADGKRLKPPTYQPADLNPLFGLFGFKPMTASPAVRAPSGPGLDPREGADQA